jgi:hypothetical protein
MQLDRRTDRESAAGRKLPLGFEREWPIQHDVQPGAFRQPRSRPPAAAPTPAPAPAPMPAPMIVLVDLPLLRLRRRQ